MRITGDAAGSRKNLLLGLIPYGAGVKEYYVRLLRPGRPFHPVFGQDSHQLFGIVLVHLASESFQVVAAFLRVHLPDILPALKVEAKCR